jgi:hypothetical protein
LETIAFFIGTLKASGGTQRMITFSSNLLVPDYNIIIIICKGGIIPFFQLDERIQIVDISAKNNNIIKKNILYIKYSKNINVDITSI